MPTLKQLTCTLETTPKNLPLTAHAIHYGDGHVSCHIVVPSHTPTVFNMHLTSSGYIAPGLAMFVFADGVLQCNRNRVNLVVPSEDTKREETEIDFRVRQKEDKIGEGKWIGREWTFEELQTVAAETTKNADEDIFRNVGMIEVVVLRCLPDDLGLDYAIPEHRMTGADKGKNIGKMKEYDDGAHSFIGSYERLEKRGRSSNFGLDGAWDEDDPGYYAEQWPRWSGEYRRAPTYPTYHEQYRPTALAPPTRYPDASPYVKPEPQVINNYYYPPHSSHARPSGAAAIDPGSPGMAEESPTRHTWADARMEAPKSEEKGKAKSEWVDDTKSKASRKSAMKASSNAGANDTWGKGETDWETDSKKNTAGNDTWGTKETDWAVGSEEKAAENDTWGTGDANWEAGSEKNAEADDNWDQAGTNWDATAGSQKKGNARSNKNDTVGGQKEHEGWHTPCESTASSLISENAIQSFQEAWNGYSDSLTESDFEAAKTKSIHRKEVVSSWDIIPQVDSKTKVGEWVQSQKANSAKSGTSLSYEEKSIRSSEPSAWESDNERIENFDRAWNKAGTGDWNGPSNSAKNGTSLSYEENSIRSLESSTCDELKKERIEKFDKAWNTAGTGDWNETSEPEDPKSQAADNNWGYPTDGWTKSPEEANVETDKPEVTESKKDAHQSISKPGKGHQKSSEHDKSTPAEPKNSYVKSYWSEWIQKHASDGKQGRADCYIAAEEPLLQVPAHIAQERNISHQVRAGKGVLYTHQRVNHPKYLDSMDKPYAVFVFKYQSKEVIEKELGVKVKPDRESYRKRMEGLSKEQVIEQLMRAKHLAGYSTDSSVSDSSESNAKTQVQEKKNYTKETKEEKKEYKKEEKGDNGDGEAEKNQDKAKSEFGKAKSEGGWKAVEVSQW